MPISPPRAGVPCALALIFLGSIALMVAPTQPLMAGDITAVAAVTGELLFFLWMLAGRLDSQRTARGVV